MPNGNIVSPAAGSAVEMTEGCFFVTGQNVGAMTDPKINRCRVYFPDGTSVQSNTAQFLGTKSWYFLFTAMGNHAGATVTIRVYNTAVGSPDTTNADDTHGGITLNNTA